VAAAEAAAVATAEPAGKQAPQRVTETWTDKWNVRPARPWQVNPTGWIEAQCGIIQSYCDASDHGAMPTARRSGG